MAVTNFFDCDMTAKNLELAPCHTPPMPRCIDLCAAIDTLGQCSVTGQQPRYPVCFLTNGGGVTEAAKAAELSQWLGVSVGADQARLSRPGHCTPRRHRARCTLRCMLPPDAALCDAGTQFCCSDRALDQAWQLSADCRSQNHERWPHVFL